MVKVIVVEGPSKRDNTEGSLPKIDYLSIYDSHVSYDKQIDLWNGFEEMFDHESLLDYVDQFMRQMHLLQLLFYVPDKRLSKQEIYSAQIADETLNELEKQRQLHVLIQGQHDSEIDIKLTDQGIKQYQHHLEYYQLDHLSLKQLDSLVSLIEHHQEILSLLKKRGDLSYILGYYNISKITAGLALRVLKRIPEVLFAVVTTIDFNIEYAKRIDDPEAFNQKFIPRYNGLIHEVLVNVCKKYREQREANLLRSGMSATELFPEISTEQLSIIPPIAQVSSDILNEDEVKVKYENSDPLRIDGSIDSIRQLDYYESSHGYRPSVIGMKERSKPVSEDISNPTKFKPLLKDSQP